MGVTPSPGDSAFCHLVRIPPKTISCGSTEAPQEPPSPSWRPGDKGPQGSAGHTLGLGGHEPSLSLAHLFLPAPGIQIWLWAPRSVATTSGQLSLIFLQCQSMSALKKEKKKKKKKKQTPAFLGGIRIILILCYCPYLTPGTRLRHVELVPAMSQLCEIHRAFNHLWQLLFVRNTFSIATQCTTYKKLSAARLPFKQCKQIF